MPPRHIFFLDKLAKAQNFYKSHPSTLYGVFVLASGMFGLGMLSWIEKVQSEAKYPLSQANLSFAEGRALKMQNEALKDMLQGLKDKTFREKIEAASEAQEKFMGPQWTQVVKPTERKTTRD